ncbi:DUF2291 domain-containing protein [Lachnoclostridium pacaense]|uniref:DUF2291 domain-containing protein n=1 Tax=Enterocloster hominis (ex Hitch et al. 2024) TaxID=1917870 RepID=UPI001D10570C|nr:DUF2291 domain-containing protein [Lachnoclostridium pacaense]MCC2817317.1 DUF2291 domain-containing protein [Lachnoclostridium pacaense]
MKKRVISLVTALILAASAFSMTGCVKVVKIGEEGKLTGDVEFNAGDNVANIWDSKALPELEGKAVDITQFLEESGGDLKSLVDKYGKYSMGTSGEINYVVKGTAVVEEVNQEKKAGYMVVKPEGYGGDVVIKLQIGSVYKGSSVRDSLDFIKFGDYKNQQEWAAVSQSFHDIIDATVVKAAEPETLQGKTIEFTGTFTANKDDEILITPVKLTVK